MGLEAVPKQREAEEDAMTRGDSLAQRGSRLQDPSARRCAAEAVGVDVPFGLRSRPSVHSQYDHETESGWREKDSVTPRVWARTNLPSSLASIGHLTF